MIMSVGKIVMTEGKMIVVDNLSLPPAAIMFGVLCTIVCLYDQIVGSSVSSKKSN